MNKHLKKYLPIIAWVYLLGAIVTFGHAYHRDYSDCTPGTALVAAPLFSALWPLYWSEVFWHYVEAK